MAMRVRRVAIQKVIEKETSTNKIKWCVYSVGRGQRGAIRGNNIDGN